jgi:hypothetical protein
VNTRDLDPAQRRGFGLRVFVPAPGSPKASPDGQFTAPDVVAAFDGIVFIDRARPATPLRA